MRRGNLHALLACNACRRFCAVFFTGLNKPRPASLSERPSQHSVTVHSSASTSFSSMRYSGAVKPSKLSIKTALSAFKNAGSSRARRRKYGPPGPWRSRRSTPHRRRKSIPARAACRRPRPRCGPRPAAFSLRPLFSVLMASAHMLQSPCCAGTAVGLQLVAQRIHSTAHCNGPGRVRQRFHRCAAKGLSTSSAKLVKLYTSRTGAERIAQRAVHHRLGRGRKTVPAPADGAARRRAPSSRPAHGLFCPCLKYPISAAAQSSALLQQALPLFANPQ